MRLELAKEWHRYQHAICAGVPEKWAKEDRLYVPDNFVEYRAIKDIDEATELTLDLTFAQTVADHNNVLSDQEESLVRVGDDNGTYELLRFGQMPPETFDNLGRLIRNNVAVCVVTNQYVGGHYIATHEGPRRNYLYFPDCLVAAIGEENIFGRTKERPGRKNSPGRVDEVVNHIRKVASAGWGRQVVAWGDKKSDFRHALLLAKNAPELTFRFYKFPEKSYNRIPVVRNMLP